MKIRKIRKTCLILNFFFLVKYTNIGCEPKVSERPTLVWNNMTYEYISMDNIRLVCGLLRKKLKVDNIIPM